MLPETIRILDIKLVFVLIFIFPISFASCQFKQEQLSNDTSEINTTRNSLYIIKEEKFKFHDSIKYQVLYIKDSSLCEEGWYNKNGFPIGKWVNYSPDGIWLNTIDHDKCSWKYNSKEYPYQSYLDSIKKICDQLIIKKYGLEFYKKNIRFKFYGNVTTKNHYYMWNEPIKEKPIEYKLDYNVIISDSLVADCYLSFRFDSIGNLLEDENYIVHYNNLLKGSTNYFSLTNKKAKQLCIQNGFDTLSNKKTESKLTFCDNISDKYAGRFLFIVTQVIDTTVTGKCPEKCTIVTIYRQWIIDPWSSKLIENKKFKRTMNCVNRDIDDTKTEEIK